MALFFDADWFDARLGAAGLTRAQLAHALALSEEQIAEMWKDQREISAHEVTLLAALLGAKPEEIAHHAGVSTPSAHPVSLADIAERLARVERDLAELKALITDPRREKP